MCYYHVQLYESLPVVRDMYIAERKNPPPGEMPIYQFPVAALEDAAVNQIGFMQALRRVANGRLDPRRAKLVLSARHGARTNPNEVEACLAACIRAGFAHQ